MLKNDKWIKTQIEKGNITSANPELIYKGVISYGVSSFGYDVALGPKLMCRKQASGDHIDPKFIHPDDWHQVNLDDSCRSNYYDVPPYSFVLGHSVEYFKIPRNITGLVFPKSTYARCGLNCFQTVLEAGWEGQITLEFANNTPSFIRLYIGEGCAQVLFLEGEPPKCSYDERNGKYQGSQGIGLPCVLAY